MPETDEGYALPYEGDAHWLARLMSGRWVSQGRAAHELHVYQMHPRLPDIQRADGAYIIRYCGMRSDKWAEYTLTRFPRVLGLSEERRRVIVINTPDQNQPPWVPPPATFKVAA